MQPSAEGVLDVVLPADHQYCIAGMGTFKGELEKDFLKNFEKNVLDLCNSKKLNAKQCGVLARDIQYKRELDKRDKAGAQ